VIALDGEARVRVWNAAAEDLRGLRADEVIGKEFFALGLGLPADDLRAHIRSCLARKEGVAPVTVNATNRRGNPVRCRITCAALGGSTGPSAGVTLVVDALSGEEK
jgi:two-component system CheB/CheR fusion protein